MSPEGLAGREGPVTATAVWSAVIALHLCACSCGDAPSAAEASARCADPGGPYDVTLARLFDEMTDLEHLTRWPEPSFESRQASSYDRRSTSPTAPGWFANPDAGHWAEEIERDGRTEYVMLRHEGPGALVRFWSARALGTLRIYVDGSEQPTIEADMNAFVRGRVPPFGPPFGYTAGNGHSVYVPIPFARSVLVTGDVKEHVFYHVGYRAYPEATRVEPWSPEALARADCARRRAAARLQLLHGGWRTPDGPLYRVEERLDVPRTGRSTVTVRAREGGAAIVRLRILPSRADEETLRGTILRVAFDDQETIAAPLGDFFGTGPGTGRTQALPVSVDGAALTSWLQMPFRDRAQLTLEGTGAAEPFQAEVRVDAVPRPFDDRSLYLHARWRPPAVVPGLPAHDFGFVELAGRGVYVGNVLNVANSSRFWWGEGDEKISVDDDAFPSFFGTGTEDYYGYAWCAGETFTVPYHGQTRVDGPGTHGHLSLYRFHVLDPIPFERRLDFDMEVLHWKEYARLSYDVVSYWYGDASTGHDVPAPDPATFRVPPVPPHEGEPAPDDVPHNLEPRVPSHCAPPGAL